VTEVSDAVALGRRIDMTPEIMAETALVVLSLEKRTPDVKTCALPLETLVLAILLALLLVDARVDCAAGKSRLTGGKRYARSNPGPLGLLDVRGVALWTVEVRASEFDGDEDCRNEEPCSGIDPRDVVNMLLARELPPLGELTNVDSDVLEPESVGLCVDVGSPEIDDD
jgi:hypothetical protein